MISAAVPAVGMFINSHQTMTKKYGLIGYPLGHSFSARFFAGKFLREGIDAVYENYELPQVDGLRRLVTDTPGLCGLNVTIPHKRHVIPLLDALSPEAEAIGAVNVIRIARGADGVRLVGFNSDVLGFSRSIAPLLRPAHRAALVLGTGGASLAVCYALRHLGVAPICVSRTAAPGRLTYGDLTEAVMAARTVVVNCSPVGTFPHIDEAPQIPYQWVTPAHLLYDLVYNPEETKFMRLGKERGAVVKNGMEMLRLQALASWEIWNGRGTGANGSPAVGNME